MRRYENRREVKKSKFQRFGKPLLAILAVIIALLLLSKPKLPFDWSSLSQWLAFPSLPTFKDSVLTTTDPVGMIKIFSLIVMVASLIPVVVYLTRRPRTAQSLEYSTRTIPPGSGLPPEAKAKEKKAEETEEEFSLFPDESGKVEEEIEELDKSIEATASESIESKLPTHLVRDDKKAAKAEKVGVRAPSLPPVPVEAAELIEIVKILEDLGLDIEFSDRFSRVLTLSLPIIELNKLNPESMTRAILYVLVKEVDKEKAKEVCGTNPPPPNYVTIADMLAKMEKMTVKKTGHS